ncbi:hypothetical protein Dsin_028175 [Dipteronia sinensis]|uniref:Reverse transcriptase zinc-binding domain-containing protein n=1 Tax=Dipteronia sinensis TaxID=43782 RepID=A0AAD9ZQB2_9ROSI|nr:hypothetical protein Dsin_028175 [Dipteronia sinensis]
MSSIITLQVLKAKYFRNETFLEVNLKLGCSYTWRSLIWGRELLAKCLLWTVGDGKSIRVFRDQWIPRPCTFKPITRDPGHDVRVADLIDRSRRGWNEEMMAHLLIPADREAILSIPVSWSGGQDCIRWFFDKSGEFMVKSGYNVALSKKTQVSVSNPSFQHKWWNSLWCLNLPPKVKVFIWRACLNALPSLVNLWKRKVVGVSRCDRCSCFSETISHALFECKVVRQIWKGTCFGLRDSVGWLAPPPGLLKLNIGTALRKASGSIGLGASIRGDKGRVLVARSKLLHGSLNGDIGQFMALRDGLMLAISYH